MGFVAAVVVLVLMFLFLFWQFLRTPRNPRFGEVPFELKCLILLFSPVVFPLKALLKLIGRVPGVGFSLEDGGGVSIRRKLEAAGIYEMEPEEYVAIQIVFPVFFSSFTFFFLYFFTNYRNSATGLTMSLLLSLLALLVGAYYPYFKICQHGELRKERIFEELPYVVDLLSLAIEAGLDFRRAVERLVQFSDDTPLVQELRIFLQDLELGASVEDALQKMAERVDILAFFSFVEALIQATRMGVDITPTLHAQAEQMRVTRFQQLEKKANETPVLLLLPTVLCIFPPILIILLTPAVINLNLKMHQLGMAGGRRETVARQHPLPSPAPARSVPPAGGGAER